MGLSADIISADIFIYMLNKQQKKELVEELADKIKRQKGLVFTDFRGLNVEELTQLRNELREIKGEYKIAKKTLINLALKKAGKDFNVNEFNNSVALTFGFEDPITPAKTICEFSKKHKALEILGGAMEGKFLSTEKVRELAKIPTKQELLAMLVGSLKSPINGLINALQGNTSKLVGVLSAISNK